jgi:putative lipoic acid-binding regulatory protein
MTETPENKTLLQFPCDFTIKVFVLGAEESETAVLMIILKYVPNLPDSAIKKRASENGTYTALSITLPIESKEQLDNIYQELTASPVVLMAL